MTVSDACARLRTCGEPAGEADPSARFYGPPHPRSNFRCVHVTGVLDAAPGISRTSRGTR